jgi:hypothetical protein
LPESSRGAILNLMKPRWMILISVAIVVLGVATGYFLTKGKVLGKATGSGQVQIQVTKDEAGINNPAALKDTAEGVLDEGGISGEGTHHLTRPGGVSQNVYLTSSVIDLQSFVGKKVQVWGLTVAGKKAGWLMDVGKVKVLQ